MSTGFGRERSGGRAPSGSGVMTLMSGVTPAMAASSSPVNPKPRGESPQPAAVADSNAKASREPTSE